MNKLHLDFETRSVLDIQKVGAWAYAAHPSTDITCLGYAFGDQKPRYFTMGEVKTMPPHMQEIKSDRRIIAHSVQFEYAIYHLILHKRYGWPALLDPSRWDCTMARALMCGLPPALDGLALALNLDFKKDLDGRAAMYATCRPRANGTWNEDPATLERLYRYNALDVETERAADKALPELPESERKIFELNLVMNRRGVPIDVRSCEKAAALTQKLTNELNAKLRKLTDGAISKASQITGMKRWIAAQGAEIPVKIAKPDEEGNCKQQETLDKQAVAEILGRAGTPESVKTVVSIRSQVGKSSTAKFNKMLQSLGADWRIRGTLQYHGAHTGRDAGRLIQPQNYPQGLVDGEQEQAISLLNDPDLFASVYGNAAMQTLSDILRGMLMAGPQYLFIGGDYNAIEARVVFWLAEATVALNMYHRGESPYLKMGADIYKRAITKKDAKEYAVAKMTVLGCGFGMGWVKFQGQALGRGISLTEEEAKKAVGTYREMYAEVVRLWYAMESAAVKAVLNPGQSFSVSGGRVMWKMSSDNKFLLCRLPSGRLLRYFKPTVRTEDSPRGEKQVLYYWTQSGEGEIKSDCNGQLGWFRTWGGELVENVVQAIARDIMVQGMLNVEAAHYKLILTVHDELLAEFPIAETRGDMFPGALSSGILTRHFTDLMCQTPEWAKGCPVAAEGWVGRRYRK